MEISSLSSARTKRPPTYPEAPVTSIFRAGFIGITVDLPTLCGQR